MRRMEATNPKGIGGCAVGVALWLLLAVNASALADSVQMKREVRIEGEDIRLSDVAALSGEHAEAHASLVVGTFGSGSETTITLDQVRRALNEHRVNWAHVSLRGFETCHVSRKTPRKTSEEPQQDTPAPQPITPKKSERIAPSANPVEEVRPGSNHTLRTRLMAWLEQVTGMPAADLRIECSSRDEATLDAPALPGKIAFNTTASRLVGRVPLTIEQYEDDKLVKSARVTLVIAQRRLVVTATKNVNRGDLIGPQDVEIREQYIDRAGDEPATRLDKVIGQQATGMLRQGQIVTVADMQPSLLVERYQIVRVKVITDTIVVNLEARALQDGARDDLIQVRNESSKETFTGRVAGPRLVVVTAGEASGEAKTSQQVDDQLSRARNPIGRK